MGKNKKKNWMANRKKKIERTRLKEISEPVKNFDQFK